MAIVAACSAAKQDSNFDDEDNASAAPSTATGSGGAGGASTSSENSSGIGGAFTGVGGGTSGQGCTGDLKGVTDGKGNVVKTCPPDQGCFEGACVPACDAAAGSKGSIGCEYWSPTPAFFMNEQANSTFHGSCFAVFVANS